MRLFIAALLVFHASFFGASSLSGSEVDAFAKRIDHHINSLLNEKGILASESVDPASFLRRITLDLAGRIPTTLELESYLSDIDQNRKQNLVQRLIESPDFAYHQRNQLDILLLLRDEHNDKWREYLLEATRENRPWDRLFREVMLPEDTLSTDPRPVAFLKRRTNDLDAMTNDSSVTWFGINIACAKCHDHPLVSDWTQAHYYGMSAFFKRTFQTKNGFLSERFDGIPKYTSTDGEEHEADFMFLTGLKADPTTPEIDAEELKQVQESIKQSESDEEADPPPRPHFRPRSRLVEIALDDDEHRYFARNIVNRLWARLLGRGIVHPLDQMHSENEPSHPELLNDLANELRQSGYDLRRLIHAIVLSDVYARGTQSAEDSELPDPKFFAVAVPRPLSPRQLSLSLRIAGTSPTTIAQWQTDQWETKRDELERQADSMARQLVIPDDGFQVSVSEALWFSNNQAIENDLLGGSSDRLVGFLKAVEADEEAARTAIKTVLSREPFDDECNAIVEYLSRRSDRREQGLKQVAWALMSSPEFRFNH